MMKGQTSRAQPVVLILIAVGLVAVFLPCWRGATFLGREDSILRLPVLSTWRNVPLIFSQDFTIFTDGLYRPLPYAAIAILRTVVPAHALCLWHTIPVALHGLNALLVFLIARRFVHNAKTALFSGAVFCFHPLASVLANEMNDVHILLGSTFYLTSLWGYFGWRDRHRVSACLLSLLAYAAGLLTSPVVATLPIVLISFEFLYEKRSLRHAAPRLLPILVLTGLAMPLWLTLRPHPLLYTYAAAKGGAVPSFLSMVAGSSWYVEGLLAGHAIPVVLRDAVRRVYDPSDTRFLLWLSFHVCALALGIWRTWKHDPIGFGILVAYAAMLPFLSTAWNPVDCYVSWMYMYVPLVGLALALGQMLSRGLSAQRIPLRVALAFPFLLLLVAYAARLCRINYVARDPVAYWTYVTQLDPTNQAAQVALGKAHLAKGAPHNALKHLFTRGVCDLNESRRALCRYYTRTGQLRAAMTHASYMTGDLDMARLFSALNMPDHAESAYGHALARNPFDTGAMKRLARILAEKGYRRAARRWLLSALDIDPTDAEAVEALDQTISSPPPAMEPPRADWLRFLLNRRSSNQVRAELVALSKEHPDDPVIQMVTAQSQIEGGNAAAGIAKLEGLKDRMLSSPYFILLYSYALTASGDARSGALVAREALTEDPKNAPLLYYYGIALLLDHRPVEAAAQFQNVIQLNPDFAEAYNKLGFAYSELGQLDEAIACYHNALKINRGFLEAMRNLASALLRRGRLTEAIAQYRANVDLAPKDPLTHFNLGYALTQAKRFDDAIASYSEAIRLKPDFVDAHSNLGGVWLAKNDAVTAIKHFRRALQIQPDNPLAHFNIARALAIQGNTDEAVAQYRKAIRLVPKDGHAHYEVAALLAQQGDFAGAIQHLTEACRLLPDAVAPIDRLAWLLATCPDATLRDGTRAVKLAERGCQLTGQRDPRLLDALAAAYAEAGRFDNAVRTAERALRTLKNHARYFSTLERNHLDRSIRERLVLYQSGRPCHGPRR